MHKMALNNAWVCIKVYYVAINKTGRGAKKCKGC